MLVEGLHAWACIIQIVVSGKTQTYLINKENVKGRENKRDNMCSIITQQGIHAIACILPNVVFRIGKPICKFYQNVVDWKTKGDNFNICGDII